MSSRSGQLDNLTPLPGRPVVYDRLLIGFLIFIGYFIAAVAAVMWAQVTIAASPVWPAAGIGIAGLALAGRRYWPAVAFAALAAMLVTHSAHSFVAQLALALSKAAGSALGATILLRASRTGQPRLTQLRDVAILLAAGTAAAVLTGAVGTATYLAEGSVPPSGALTLFVTWLLSDAVGTFIFGALVLAWQAPGDRVWRAQDWGRLAAILVTTAAVSALTFYGGMRPASFYLYPVLVWAAFDKRVTGASLSLAVVALVTIASTARGYGPFVTGSSPISNLIALQQFLAVSALMALLLAAVSEERHTRARMQTAQAELLAASRLAELTSLYQSAPIGLAFFDREYRYLRINDELAAINGVPAQAHIGRTIREVLTRNAPQVEPMIDDVFETGRSVRDFEVSGETPQQPGVVRHWLTGLYPVKDLHGAVEAVGIWVVEISERKKAEEREALLAREVDHRAKNLLAVVQSVVQLTQAEEPDELKAGIIGRIQALARAHSLLADSRWDGALLGDLVREELAPYLDGAGARAVVGGPALLLRPAAAQSLAVVLHELATNAAKYGALSDANGRLDVSWRRTADAVELVWTEHDGPPVKPPRRSGFGSKIMNASIERQLHGDLEQEWRPEGLHCTIRISAREAAAGADQG